MKGQIKVGLCVFSHDDFSVWFFSNKVFSLTCSRSVGTEGCQGIHQCGCGGSNGGRVG